MNKLTDIALKKAKATDKTYKMTDGHGLYLQVDPNGGKYWRMAYRFAGKQKTFAIGVYPEVSLAEARALRDDARKLLRNNVDPTAAKQAQKETPWKSLKLGNSKARKLSINLWPGQIIVRIDLAAAIVHKGAIEKQVGAAFENVKSKVAVFENRYSNLSKLHNRSNYGITNRFIITDD